MSPPNAPSRTRECTRLSAAPEVEDGAPDVAVEVREAVLEASFVSPSSTGRETVYLTVMHTQPAGVVAL